MGFFYVIESPADKDLFDGTGQSLVMGEICHILRWPCVSRIVTSKPMLKKAFKEIRTDSEVVMIHMAAHGNAEGIGLTDGEFIRWDELVEIGHKAFLEKIVVISACESDGSNGLCEAMRKAGTPAFFVTGTQRLISHEEALTTWPLFYSTFRRVFFEDKSLKGNGPLPRFKEAFQEAVKLVNAICGDLCVYQRWDGEKGKFVPYSRSATIN